MFVEIYSSVCWGRVFGKSRRINRVPGRRWHIAHHVGEIALSTKLITGLHRTQVMQTERDGGGEQGSDYVSVIWAGGLVGNLMNY